MWKDTEIIILREISHTEKDKCHMMLLICGIYISEYIYTYMYIHIYIYDIYTSEVIYKTEINSQA